MTTETTTTTREPITFCLGDGRIREIHFDTRSDPPHYWHDCGISVTSDHDEWCASIWGPVVVEAPGQSAQEALDALVQKLKDIHLIAEQLGLLPPAPTPEGRRATVEEIMEAAFALVDAGGQPLDDDESRKMRAEAEAKLRALIEKALGVTT